MSLTLSSSRLAQSPSLASVVAQRLREEIEARRPRLGERFPTDAEISKAFGVSRNVVREAVSALREEGLISTQRGRGSVIAGSRPSRPFGISAEEIGTLDDVVRVLELRTALEVEAAAMAALRRTKQDIAKIAECLGQLDTTIGRGQDAIEADIDFHLAIAAATQNDYFPRLLGTFRSVFVARRRIRGDLDDPERLQSYMHLVQQEHRQIALTISEGNSAGARRAMRRHLVGKRYRELQKQLRKTPA
jgi:GntR family transcriptional regulator, transcriptional repressor for pyruvate dehydrogenase complex